MVGPRLVAQPADVVGQHTGDEPRIRVGEEAHGVAYPVVASEGMGRGPVLVDEDSDGVLVVEAHLGAVGFAVGEHGVARQFAYAHGVGAQEVGRGLDVLGHGRGIVGARRRSLGHTRHWIPRRASQGDAAGIDDVLRRFDKGPKIASHACQRPRKRVFGDEPLDLPLHGGTVVARVSLVEPPISLVDPRHRLVAYDGGRAVNPFQDVVGIATMTSLVAAFSGLQAVSFPSPGLSASTRPF